MAKHFLEKYSLQMNRAYTEIDPKAMDLLVRYAWPGNVRELANAVERALVVGKPPTLQVDDLPLQLSESAAPPLGESLANMEQVHIEKILGQAGWNITHAAETLQIDRVTLYNKIKKYGLHR